MKKVYCLFWLFVLSVFFVQAQNVAQPGLSISNRQFGLNDTIASAASISTMGQVVVQQGTAVAFRSQQHIFLGPGFETQPGALFSALVKKVPAVGDSLATKGAMAMQDGGLTIYPNPARDIVYLSSRQPFTKVTVVNMLGQIVYACSYSTPASMTISLDLSDQCPGLYFVQVAYPSNLMTKKILLAR